MALIGNYREYKVAPSETEFQTIQKYDPETGKTTTEEHPKMVETFEEFEDVYVIIRAASMHQRVSMNTKSKDLFISCLVSVYRDKDHKTNDFYNELHHDVVDIPIDSLSDMANYENALAYAYDKFKEQREAEFLRDE
jgi:hypothetical protein